VVAVTEGIDGVDLFVCGRVQQRLRGVEGSGGRVATIQTVTIRVVPSR
jgi:hypothetical protein